MPYPNECRLTEEACSHCGRHDFGTVITARTGNLKAVMKVMGHKDVKTAMKYQHPEVDIVRAALDPSQENVSVQDGT